MIRTWEISSSIRMEHDSSDSESDYIDLIDEDGESLLGGMKITVESITQILREIKTAIQYEQKLEA